jgi:tRNA(Ile)-lysidine synthase
VRLAVAPQAPPSSPVEAGEFAALMAPLGPWEVSPRLAVGVSGGADSMALALLAAAWARARGGSLDALVVDHGLRPHSAEEAAETGRRLLGRGIAARVLREQEAAPAPQSRLQEWARGLRYRLLTAACVDLCIPHLLIGHHRDDQAETLLLRLSSGSGVRGLAGMACTSLAPDGRGRVRLLRPLLALPKSRLRATLTAAGQEWIEDPSNLDPRFGRVRLRRALPLLAAAGLTAEMLAAGAAEAAEARAVLDRAALDWLAAAATPSPLGHVAVRMAGFAGLAPAVRHEAIRRLIAAVGGGAYPPRGERLRRLAQELTTGAAPLGRCLGGCVLRLEQGTLVVTREPAAVAGPVPAAPGLIRWDGRFEMVLADAPGRLRRLTVAGLGSAGLAEIRRRRGREVPSAPTRQLATLPALWQGRRLIEAPFPGFSVPRGRGLVRIVAWAPRQPLSG